jgi:hypothetical protein
MLMNIGAAPSGSGVGGISLAAPWRHFSKSPKEIRVPACDSKLRQAQCAMTRFHPLETTRIVHNSTFQLPLRAGVAPYAPRIPQIRRTI